MKGEAYPARHALVARGPGERALNPAKLAARLFRADRVALWIVGRQAPSAHIWSQGFAHHGLERERNFIEHLPQTEDLLCGRPRTVSRESLHTCLRAPDDLARAGGWRFATLWPIPKKNRLSGIVVCYFDDAIPPKRNRLKQIQAVPTHDSFSSSDPRGQTSSLTLISQSRSPGNLTPTCRSKDPAAQIRELTLDAIRLALPFCTGGMLAVGRSERSSFHIVAASGPLEDQVGLPVTPPWGFLHVPGSPSEPIATRSRAILRSEHSPQASRLGRPSTNGFSWLRSGLGNGCWARISPSQKKMGTTR